MDISSNKLRKLHMKWPKTWLWRGNLKRTTESLLIVVQYNAIRTSYVEAEIVNTQESVGYVVMEMKQLIT